MTRKMIPLDPICGAVWSLSEAWSNAVGATHRAGRTPESLEVSRKAKLHYDGALEVLAAALDLAGEDMGPTEFGATPSPSKAEDALEQWAAERGLG